MFSAWTVAIALTTASRADPPPSSGTAPSTDRAVEETPARVARSVRVGRAGIALTYGGLGLGVLGGGALALGANIAGPDATDQDWASSPLIVGGGVGIGLGSAAFLAGPHLLSGSAAQGSLRLNREDPSYSWFGGQVALGGSGATLLGLALVGPAEGWGALMFGAGHLTALTAGHIQHGRNRMRAQSLGYTSAPTPQRVQVALVPSPRGLRLAGTF